MDGKPEAPSLQKEQDKDGEAAPSLEKDARAKNETSDTQKQFYVIPTGTTQWFENVSKGKTIVLQVISSFEYPKLPGPEYIRLIHLYPAGNQPSILNASLEVHKLDAQCDYEAISYTWGDYSDPNGTIVLNGQVLKTTLNLYAALMAYSYTDRVRVLWADAVCINQMDAAEKAQQVSIMSDIYSMAKTVQVWLAPHSQATNTALEFMKQLSLRAEDLGISKDVDHPRVMQGYPTLSISNEAAAELIHLAIEACVDYLLFRSWHNRIWIIQEVALASKLVVSCGHARIDWTDYARALEVLRGAYRQIPNGEDRDRMDAVKAAWGLVQVRDGFKLLDKYCNRDHHLVTNLVGKQMCNKACTDDHDRVYAMLAMTRSPYTMVADYTKTVAEAYTKFARTHSPNTQIYSAGLCRRHPQEKTKARETSAATLRIDFTDRDYLPSWVPEFRPALNLAWASPFTGAYRTANAAPFYFFGHPGFSTVMCATGTIFDIIGTATWEYKAGSAPHCRDNPEFFFSLVNCLQAIPCRPNPFVPELDILPAARLDDTAERAINPTTEPLWMILVKTLTGGVSDCRGAEDLLARYPSFKSLRHLQTGSLAWLTAIWNCFATHCLSPTGEIFQRVLLKSLGAESEAAYDNLTPDAEVALGFLTYLANILVPNRMFVTIDGYVGLAARNLRVGDMIAVFNGCHMPFVVRSVGKLEHEGKLIAEGGLQVIGPCYVHGIMNGEIITHRNEAQFKRLKWTRHDGDELDSLQGWMVMI
jgi:hypothetical protein